MHVSIVKKPGLILLHDWRNIRACLPIADWPFPIERLKPADRWDRLAFSRSHQEPVALFVNRSRNRLTLTGQGLFQCALDLVGQAGSFDVEEMVERILGQYSECWHSSEDFLTTTAAYLARQSGKLVGPIPGDNSDRRAYLSPKHERRYHGAFWDATFGPVRLTPSTWALARK